MSTMMKKQHLFPNPYYTHVLMLAFMHETVAR